MNPPNLNNQSIIECGYCGYDKNPVEAKHCQKCGKPLNVISLKDKAKVGNQPKPKPIQDFLLAPWIVRSIFGLLFLFLSWLIYSLFITVSQVSNSNDISKSDVENVSQNVQLFNLIKDVPNVPEGTFNYGGSSSFAALTAQGLHEAIDKAHPNFRLRFTQSRDGKTGGKKGVAMLLDSQLSFTMFGSSLTDAHFSKAKQRGFGLRQIPIFFDPVSFYTHRDIAIPGLTVEQIQDIYKGKITNWKQLGGVDLPIIPFARDPVASNALNEVLGLEVDQYSSKVQITNSTTETIRKVASTPGGISFGGTGLIVGQQTIRPLAIAKTKTHEYIQLFSDDSKQINATAIRDGSYPLTRRRFIVYRQDGTIEQLAGEAYTNMLLSNEGQRIIEKTGFIPLR